MYNITICTSEDNEENGNNTRQQMQKCVWESGYEITPTIFKEKMGYHWSDYFVKIVTYLTLWGYSNNYTYWMGKDIFYE